ncbi:uncharacterized protein LOC129938765 isoform X2 [Eupeodes corollae]|nr:uncharacterized protein LOC129938765 isoform X2 [Eupeodes corollae]XP_055902495.1 uncharacterized protein LOC129938765 isoform X2 [Eupeodes corollae]
MPRVRVRDAEEDDKENIEQFHERLHAALTPSKLKRQPNVGAVDNTLMNDSDEALDMTNTSFETLEKMCEKTASDPDSTLFKYLGHGSSPASRQPIRAGNRVRPPTFDEEADALQRLLDELNVEETEKRMQNLPTLADDTQLDDIEAPSIFWENTMTPDALKSISPCKMVGLMRQSTIMEEFSDVSESDEVSSMSYESARKTCYSSETTGCYETANDTAAGSERAVTKNVSANSSGRSSSSELFQQRHSRQKFFSNDTTKKTESEEQIEENPEKSIHLIDFGFSKEEDDPLAKSLHLIDLDTTVKSPQEDEENWNEQETELALNLNCPSSESTEQGGDEEEIEKEREEIEKEKEKEKDDEYDEEEDYSLEPLKSSLETSTQLIQSDNDESLVIELSDDDESAMSCEAKPSAEESTLNRSFTIKSEEQPLEDEKSLHFNDTMEEVEYMMSKGMQYMQAAKENLQQPEQKSSPMVTVKNHLTPVKKFERYRSPSPMLSSPHTPKTVIAKPKPVNKHVLDIKPFPKLDLFKKPQLNALKPQNKSAKKQQFSHVVSPIGAYIKKTPTTPLLSSVRNELVGTSAAASSSSKAFRKLDCDGRLTPGNGSPRIQPKTPTPVRSLPKKAYISSEYKHIVDERTQYTIPGGPKIQKYLVSAMIPAVVRHEGKVKIPENLRTSDMKSSAAPRRTDDSLADLSVASGDVSVYTIRDAQKF